VAAPAQGRGVSLQTKLLLSYVILGVFLLVAIPFVQERLLPGQPITGRAVILGLTLVAGYALSTAVLRVARLTRLKGSALEISAGDLSKSVISEEQRGLHDEVDDLTASIRTMQENLRDLVSRIQRTAQSVADSANEL
jgi:methyl-accepting chemotaxis protein